MAREVLESEGAICIADDLVSLAQLTDHSILNCLRERFHDDQIYVSCYTRGLADRVDIASSLSPIELYVAADNK